MAEPLVKAFIHILLASSYIVLRPDGIACQASSDLSATLEPIRRQGGAPALACAVWKGAQLVSIGATGVRKFGDPTRVTINDKWHLGSDTKAMTATLVGIFIEKGRLRFDSTLGSLFSNETTVHADFRNVTIEQLLQHRGGMPADEPERIWSQMWEAGNASDARISAVRALLLTKPVNRPGTRFLYSNPGYMVVGAALERLEGLTWERLTTLNLFTPLGMTGCGFGAPGHRTPVDQPWGHEQPSRRGGNLRPIPPDDPESDNPPSGGPAGSIHCSLDDWGKFLALHLAGARGEHTSLLTTATLKRLQTAPRGGDYAAGWIVDEQDWAGGKVLTHSGSNTLWYATAWLAPVKNLAFACATNYDSKSAEKAVDDAFGPLITSQTDYDFNSSDDDEE